MKEILRSLRNEHNYSQSAVAAYLEISRQMYNKYESGTAEPSLKNIKKLCELYKVSADLFLGPVRKEDEKVEYPYTSESSACLSVASPSVSYGEAPETSNSKTLLSELVRLIPLLKLNEQISLMSRLANIIEKQTCVPDSPVIKTKKMKKIPDTAYNQYVNSEDLRILRESSLATIREILKNDEW